VAFLDKIRIHNLKFYTYNGVLPEEKKLGQQIEIDVELQLPLAKAGKTDDVLDTVSYAEVCELITKRVTTHNYDLMEAVVSAILDDIEEHFASQLTKAIVKVRKYSVPMPGSFDNIEIEMEREFAL
jgi:dihydroneopterin aldolase